MNLKFSRTAFTLIELIIVLVLIGILAAVAIPRYVNLSSQAQESSIQATLTGVREAINLYHSEQVASGNHDPVSSYPSLLEVNNSILQGPIPANPWVSSSNIVVLASASTTRGVAGVGGWNYNRSNNGEFWANSNTIGENLW